MSGSIVRAGQYAAGAVPNFLVVAPQIQRSSVTHASGSGLVWWYALGGRVGVNGTGTGYYRLYVADTVASSEGANGYVPSAVLAYTDEKSTNKTFQGSNEGETVLWPITPFLGNLNKSYAFGATDRTLTLSVGMVVNTTSYLHEKTITAGSTIPQAGYTSRPAYGHLYVWLEGEVNVKPNQPGVVSISAGSGTKRPTFKASYSDPNQVLNNGAAGDYLQSVIHEVWWNGNKEWSLAVDATTAERNGNYSEAQITKDIPYDTPFTYYVYHIDRGGLQSIARSYSGIVPSQAAVDAPTSPAGFVTNLTNPGNIVAVYRNNAGTNANGMKAQLRNATGALLLESPIKSVSVAPGGTLSMTWAESTFGTLTAGTGYRVTVQARTTAGDWSPVSSHVSFNTNAPPNTPQLVSPASGSVLSAQPLLTATVTDPDNAITSVQVRILNSGGTVLYTRNMTLAGDSLYQYQVTSVDVAAYGTFLWDVIASDGFLSSARSEQRSFQYAAVPTVTITGPAGPTIGTSKPAYTWTCANQTYWRLTLRDLATNVIVYDTGLQTGSAQTHTLADQYWLGGERWNRNEIMAAVVTGRDNTGLDGSSASYNLQLVYPAIDVLQISGSAESLPNMTGTHYVNISVLPSAYPESQFRNYICRRVMLTGEAGSEIEATRVVLKQTTSASITNLVDFEVESKRWYRYSASQVIQFGDDIIESDGASVDVMIDFTGILLHEPARPFDYHLALLFPSGETTPVTRWLQGRSSVLPIGARAPWDYGDNSNTYARTHSHMLVSVEGRSADDQLADLRLLWEEQRKQTSHDSRAHILCLRDGRGGPGSLIHGVLTEVTETEVDGWTPHGGVREITFGFEERAFRLGEEE